MMQPGIASVLQDALKDTAHKAHLDVDEATQLVAETQFSDEHSMPMSDVSHRDDSNTPSTTRFLVVTKLDDQPFRGKGPSLTSDDFLIRRPASSGKKPMEGFKYVVAPKPALDFSRAKHLEVYSSPEAKAMARLSEPNGQYRAFELETGG